MPQYDYHCKKCNGDFSINCSAKDDRSGVTCPNKKCKPKSPDTVYRMFGLPALKGLPTVGMP